MKSFVELNLRKLPYVFILIAGIFLTLVTIIIGVFSILDHRLPEFDTVFFIVLIFGIGIPCILIVLTYIQWYFRQRVRLSALGKNPFNQLEQIGFCITQIDNTKWSFTEETMEVKISGIDLQFDVNRDTPQIVEFTAFVQHPSLNKEKIRSLESEFKNKDIYFGWDGVVKKYNFKKYVNLTITQVETDLVFMVEKLIVEGFVSKK